MNTTLSTLNYPALVQAWNARLASYTFMCFGHRLSITNFAHSSEQHWCNVTVSATNQLN